MLLPFKGVAYELSTLVHGQGSHTHARKMPCSDIEMNTVECLEAYGVIKGKERCIKYIEDLSECRHARLRQMRFYAMRMERIKKVAKGEIPWEKRWGNAYPYESFVTGTFIP